MAIEKNSVLADMLSSVKEKVADAGTYAGNFVGTTSAAAGGTSSTSSTSWLMPLLVIAGIAFAAVKLLPKVFKKGSGSRPTRK